MNVASQLAKKKQTESVHQIVYLCVARMTAHTGRRECVYVFACACTYSHRVWIERIYGLCHLACILF